MKKKIKNNLNQLHESFEKRRKALGYCTITFIGRSKAGKSTLWSVMTDTGFDGIGVGRQNTTRENHEYKIKNIRLIDTPGVQTPDGKELEEIAKKVVDETDLICFVMTDNNQQESEFRFLQFLREREKPFLILLNIKEDVSNPKRKTRFLENPDKLFSVEDKKALGGHIDRIRRYAEYFYGTSNFPIIPVQLLAAQIALQNPINQDSQSLWKASRFSDFLEGVKHALLNQGTLRCTQKNIGGLVSQITDLRNDLEINAKEYQNFFEKTERLLKKAVKEVEKARKSVLQSLDTKLKEISLYYEVSNFAKRYCDCSGITITKAWRDVVERSNTDVQEIFRSAGEEFSWDVKEIVKDLEEEFILESRYASFSNSSEFGSFDLTSWRWFENITKSILGTVAFMVGGVWIGIGFAVFSLFNWSESKEEKIKKAISHLEEKLKKECDRFYQNVSKNKELFSEESQKPIDLLKNILSECKESSRFFDNALTKEIDFLSSKISFLNKYFGARILAFANGHLSESSVFEWIPFILHVKNNDKEIKIYLQRLPIYSLPALEDLKSILQKNVVVMKKK